MTRSGSDRLVRAWLATAVSDFTFASLLTILVFHSTFARLWQGVASVPFGAQALEGHTHWVLIGIVLHFCTAFFWSAVYYFVVSRWGVARRALATPGGIAKVAAVYGPCIWLVMSLAVIPLFRGVAPSFTTRWLIQLIGHFPFVGLPMVAAIGREPTGR